MNSSQNNSNTKSKLKKRNTSTVLQNSNYNSQFETLVKSKIVETNFTSRPVNTYIEDRGSNKIVVRYSKVVPEDKFSKIDSSLLMHSSDSMDSIFTNKDPKIAHLQTPNSYVNTVNNSRFKYNQTNSNSNMLNVNKNNKRIVSTYNSENNVVNFRKPNNNSRSSDVNRSCFLPNKLSANKDYKNNNNIKYDNKVTVIGKEKNNNKNVKDCENVDDVDLSKLNNQSCNNVSKVTYSSPEKTVKFKINIEKGKKTSKLDLNPCSYDWHQINNDGNTESNNNNRIICDEKAAENSDVIKMTNLPYERKDLNMKLNKKNSKINQTIDVEKYINTNNNLVSEPNSTSNNNSNSNKKEKKKNISCSCFIF